jgi:hypothetical protein
VTRGWVIVGVAAVAFGSVVAIRTMQADRQCARLGAIEMFPANSVSYVKCVPAYVVSDSNHDIVVYYGLVRLGGGWESLRWDGQEQLFVAVTSDRKFVVNGTEYTPEQPDSPVGRVLTTCPWRVTDGNLWIDAGQGSSPEAARAACLGNAG